jgi:hypothetical protein
MFLRPGGKPAIRRAPVRGRRPPRRRTGLPQTLVRIGPNRLRPSLRRSLRRLLPPPRKRLRARQSTDRPSASRMRPIAARNVRDLNRGLRNRAILPASPSPKRPPLLSRPCRRSGQPHMPSTISMRERRSHTEPPKPRSPPSFLPRRLRNRRRWPTSRRRRPPRLRIFRSCARSGAPGNEPRPAARNRSYCISCWT